MPTDADLDGIVPVVLAGGRSRRFGRDKLREPVGDRRLVDHPVAALRSLFGPRVVIVGDCDTSVRSAADAWIPDEHPGIGPMGGIATALRRLDRPVLVLAGDLAAIDVATVRTIAQASLAAPAARVVLAVSGNRPAAQRHPCTAVYAPSMLEPFEAMIEQRRHGLLTAIDHLDPAAVLEIRCDPRRLANINEPGDLEMLLGSAAATAHS